MKTFSCLFVSLFLASGAASFLYGQAEVTGRIVGVVTDPSKALVPGVTVTVEGPALFAPRSVLTAEDATYFVDKLPLGTYKVTFVFPGFKTIVRDDVNVRANFTATINVSLEVGAVEETLMVTEAAPVVDVRSATTATTFDSGLLKEIPSGRDTWSTLAQVPGLTPAKFDVGGNESFQQTGTQVHGSASSQTVYSVNGLNLNYPGGSGGSTAFYFDNEAFEEVQVVTDAAQAETGVGGVLINMITRQGSNEVHGSLSGFYTTHGLTSRPTYPVFNGQRIEAGTTITMMRDTDVRMGFPIIRDRLWWYAGYRRYDINLAVPGIKRLDGSAIKDNNHQGNVTARTDISITSRQRVSLNWLYNDINRFFRRGSGFVDDVASGKQLEHAWVGQAQYTYTPTSNLVLETRFGNMTLHFPQLYQSEVVPGTIAVVDSILNTTKYARPAGQTLTSSWHARGSQNASYFKGAWLGGSHNIRGGGEYAHESLTNNQFIYRDLVVTLANGQPLNATLYNTPLQARARFNETALFIQDSYVVGRLTINGGVRYDRWVTFLPAQTSPAGTWVGARSYGRSRDITTWNDLSPRIGVAYDLNGRGRTVLRGSFSQNVLLEGSRLATALNPNALSSSNVTFTGLAPDNYPLGLSSTPIFQEGGQFTTIDPKLSRPYSRQFTVGYEQQIVSNLRASLGYYYRDTLNNFSRVNRAAGPSDYSPLNSTNPLTNEPITIYNLATNKVGLSDFLITNFPQLDDNAYHGVEISASKRMSNNWQLLGGFTAQRKRGTIFDATGDDLNNPNRDIFRNDGYLENDSTYVFKLAGTYNLPKGITTSANFQHYTGYPIQATGLFRSGIAPNGTNTTLNQNSVTVALQPRGQERLDDVNVLNLRFGYRTTVTDRFRVQPSVDLYNITNRNTVTGITQATGPNFRKPETIVGQRFVRFGLSIEF
jgi:hypothetical protein